MDEKAVTVIHCWSAPRSRSTALLYSFEARGAGTVALDEPLYATWLLHESQHGEITRPYLSYIQEAAAMMDRDDHDKNTTTFDPQLLKDWQNELRALPQKFQAATEQLLLQPSQKEEEEEGNLVIFCKHMAKFWNVYDRSRDEVPNVVLTIAASSDPNRHRTIPLRHVHVLLLRDPMDVVTSWNAIGTSVYGDLTSHTDTTSTTTTGGNPIHEIGMVPLLQIYSTLSHRHSTTTTTNPNCTAHNTTAMFVLDAEELIQYPERTLQRLCHHCQISFRPAMYVVLDNGTGCGFFLVMRDTFLIPSVTHTALVVAVTVSYSSG